MSVVRRCFTDLGSVLGGINFLQAAGRVNRVNEAARIAQERAMPKNKVIGLHEAISHIESGMSIAIGGFLSQGDPLTLMHGLMDSDVKDLTIYSCTGGFRQRGITELVTAGKVKKLVCSHIGTTPDVVKAYRAGELEVELVPQGTLAERLRAGGAGLGGFITPVGLGTKIADGKQTVEVDGNTFLVETAIKCDIALVRAHDGDTIGNLRFRGTAGNYNAVCAMCSDYVVAEVEYICDPGEISPLSVHVPSIFVDAVVRADLFYRGSSLVAG
jgi:acetate CoA/acetoacetate CoA-transferase alpha subunit